MSVITPHYRTVQQLLQSQSFSIDDYQREYKWGKDNIDELLSDLRTTFYIHHRQGDLTTAVSHYSEYFLGSIIVSKRNGKNYLVDGQQRVTSLTLLLIYLYREASERELPVVTTVAPLIFSDYLGQKKFNLDIPERLPVIEALFNGTPFSPDGADESTRAMYARYVDIRSDDLVEELGESLPHFIYWLLTRVGLIEIATDQDNHAYAIFETMNDRGKSLSPVDMLKAYLLVPIEDTSARSTANQKWKQEIFNLISETGVEEKERDLNCFKAWLRAQHADSTRDRRAQATDRDWELIGRTFHRWVRENHKNLGLGTANANFNWMVKSLPFFANAYRQVQQASTSFTPELEAIYYNAHNDFTWQNTVLLAPLVESDDDVTVRRKLAVTATYLDIWVMRRAANYIRVGYSSVSYAMWLLCRDIRRKPLDELIEVLEQKLDADEARFDGYELKGRRGIAALVVNQFTRRYIFHLLARLTAVTELGSGRPASFDLLVNRNAKNPFDIEHLLPNDYDAVREVFKDEREFEEARDHVASLVLLPADVNRSLQDKPFDEKLDAYSQQNMYAASLNKLTYDNSNIKFMKFKSDNALPFEHFDRFTKAEHEKRLSLVISLVNLVWSPNRLRESGA